MFLKRFQFQVYERVYLGHWMIGYTIRTKIENTVLYHIVFFGGHSVRKPLQKVHINI
mgnify:CR=1 FL=1